MIFNSNFHATNRFKISVVCTSNTSNLSIVHPIRSYRTRSAQTAPCTILEAACACVAFPDTFVPVTIGSGHKQVTLVDGLAVAANPGKELLAKHNSVWRRCGGSYDSEHRSGQGRCLGCIDDERLGAEGSGEAGDDEL